MKRYKFANKTMWGRCKHCFKPLTDDDFIDGCGYCQTCDIILSAKKLQKLIDELEKDLAIKK